MVGKTFTRTLWCLLVISLACGTLLAQSNSALKIAPPPSHPVFVTPFFDTGLPPANITVFTNLTTDPANLYNAAAGGYYVSGPNAIDNPSDQWIAIPFTNKVADHAKTLQTAIGWISGTKRVTLGIYTDNPGVGPGTVLAGGSASTATVPTSGTCCALTSVNLAGAGVALAANTKYWLVATTDDVHAPDFEAVWQASYSSDIGGDVGNAGWFTFSGLVPAAQIKGTNP